MSEENYIETINKAMSLMDVVKLYESTDFKTGTDKNTLHTYIATYNEYLSRFVNKGISILEIGIETGKSLLMWNHFLVNANIYGIDINPKPPILNDYAKIICHQMSSTDSTSVNSVFVEKQFDIIIDDGSHEYNDQLNTFMLFSSKLKPDGIYFIEDVSVYELLNKINVLGYNVKFHNKEFNRKINDNMLIITRL